MGFNQKRRKGAASSFLIWESGEELGEIEVKKKLIHGGWSFWGIGFEGDPLPGCQDLFRGGKQTPIREFVDKTGETSIGYS